jgi:ribosomal protein L37AE/L43A
VSFDDIPEDEEESFPCDCGGSITKDEVTGLWSCDDCGRVYLPENVNAH